MRKTILDFWSQAGMMEPSYANLEAIHTLFVHEPVFNSLNILLGKRPKFDTKWAFHTVVNRESGTCQVINLAAKYLLELIGYKNVRCISCEVSHIHGTPVPKGSAIHMTMVVTVVNSAGCEEEYLFDPGFGNGHRKPLPLNGEVVNDLLSPYRVIVDKSDGRYAVQEFLGEWKTQFLFNPNDILDLAAFNRYVDFAFRDERFFRNSIYMLKCSPEGCISIYNDTFTIQDRSGAVERKCVLAEGGLRRLLLEKFGLAKDYLDSIDLNSDDITPGARELLQKIWKPSPQASSTAWMTPESKRLRLEDDELTPPSNGSDPPDQEERRSQTKSRRVLDFV